MEVNGSFKDYEYTNKSVVYPSKYTIKKHVLGARVSGGVVFVTEELNILVIRLRLLALVLALALTWYAVNPAPGPVRRVKRDEGPPGEKRREAGSRLGMSSEVLLAEAVMNSAAGPLPSDTERDIDDLEWPEVIGVG